MTQYLSITETRQRFLELADTLGNEPLYVTRHGTPVLVVLRQGDYESGTMSAEAMADRVARGTPGQTRHTMGSGSHSGVSRAARLELFDRATERLRSRATGRSAAGATGRGWQRDELYERGRDR